MRLWWKIPVVIAGIIVTGFLIGWLGSRGPVSKTIPISAGPTGPSPVPAENSSFAFTSSNSAPARLPAPTPLSAGTNGPLTHWEARVDAILDSDLDDTHKVAELLKLLPQLPEDGQIAVAQDLSNLVDDRDYATLAPLLQAGRLPGPALDVLMADALGRPDALKLPLLLELARNPAHPKAGEAREMLASYLDADYGNDWDLWRQKIQAWLRENPD